MKTRKKPLFVGLTGGIASGKTTVAGMFRKHGIPVIDADTISRELVRAATPVGRRMIRHFGKRILDAKGEIDRRALADIIFNDEAERRVLEAIVHPPIMAAMRAKVLKYRGHPLVILDIPLLFETRQHVLMDATIVVSVPRTVQIQRMRTRDHLTLAEAKSRLAAQWPLSQKSRMADIVINNSRTHSSTAAQVKRVVADFMKQV